MAGHCEGAGRARSEGIGELGVPGRCQASTPPSGRNACLRAHPSAADMTAAGLPAGFARLAPPLPGRALSQQQWRYVTFLHWQVDEHLVAKLLPAGTRPDLFDGVTYVGLVAFVMADAGLGVRRPVPWLGTFPETNVRFYSVDEQGRHGVRQPGSNAFGDRAGCARYLSTALHLGAYASAAAREHLVVSQ